MGLFINLNMGFTCSRDEWADIWDGTFDILERFPATLCCLVGRDTPHGERLVLTDNLRIVTDAGQVYWKMEGDMESRQMGETFTLYRDLEYYPKLHDEVGRAISENSLDAIKRCLTRVFREREFILKESAWAELDKSTNAFLLTCFFILGAIPSSEASIRNWSLFLLEHPRHWPALEEAARK